MKWAFSEDQHVEQPAIQHVAWVMSGGHTSRASGGPNKIILFGGFRFAPPTIHLNY
jgi:hypothetical protein